MRALWSQSLFSLFLPNLRSRNRFWTFLKCPFSLLPKDFWEKFGKKIDFYKTLFIDSLK
jgi:hypothetical protein